MARFRIGDAAKFKKFDVNRLLTELNKYEEAKEEDFE